METATIPFQLNFKINEKTSPSVVCALIKELHPKYKRFYDSLIFDPPYPENDMEWKVTNVTQWSRISLPFLRKEILSIELTLWNHLIIMQGTPSRASTDNAIRLLNLLKAHPCKCPDEKAYIKW